MAEALTVILTLVGIGILVVGILLLLQLRSAPVATAAPATVVVRESPRYWGRGWRHRGYPMGPYYSHLPVRPLLY